jgi:ankyrin repeat protein
MKIVSEQIAPALSAAIANGDGKAVQHLIEQHHIEVDAYMDRQFYSPVVMELLCSDGFKSEQTRLTLLRYVLEKGANPNKSCKSGYNCLHLAAQHDQMAAALSLFLEFKGDVNLQDHNGAVVAYWAIQSFPWRKTGADRQLHLDVLEKIFMLGANLDLKNKYGVSPRDWLERSPDDVQELAEKCARLNPVYVPGEVLTPEFPSSLQYPEIAQKIWNELVPLSGPSDNIFGEMLRSVEKLRDEAQRNGNINYYAAHKQMAVFVRDTLIQSGIFDKKVVAEIKKAASKMLKAGTPCIEDEPYDFLTDQICLLYNNCG